jgi:hypothetical protein
LEEISQEYQLEAAALNRDMSMISSALEFGIKSAAYKEGL